MADLFGAVGGGPGDLWEGLGVDVVVGVEAGQVGVVVFVGEDFEAAFGFVLFVDFLDLCEGCLEVAGVFYFFCFDVEVAVVGAVEDCLVLVDVEVPAVGLGFVGGVGGFAVVCDADDGVFLRGFLGFGYACCEA